MPPDNDVADEVNRSGKLPNVGDLGDGAASSDDGGTTLPRRTFLKGSGALATTAGLASARANAGDDARADDVLDEVEGGKVRHFEAHAIDVDIVYNRYGQHQPNGAMFVLEENLEAAREASGETPDDAFDDLPCDGDDEKDEDDEDGVDTSVIQPLVIRANKGDVVEIEFHNDLDRRASIHQTALPYEVETSDGMAVGFNEDTTVAPGESTTYRWYAAHEGTHYFRDGVSQAFDSTPDGNPEEVNNLARGLFGAIVVEPEGATWTDPETGGELRSGIRADVHDPEGIGTSHREFVIFYHDPGEILNADGSEPTWPSGDTPQGFHGLNYRGDQTGVRVEDDCEGCEEEENFYSSWTHGDPGGGDAVYETYVGDPVKMVIVGANLEENHSHHIHNHRWKEIPGRSDSDTIDAQSVGPGGTYDTYLTVGHGEEDFETINPEMTWKEAFEVGIGSGHGTVGDVLFHCHLFPHYGEGMNSLVRINDKEQPDLQQLPNNEPPIPADSDTPGFPEFVPGERGEGPPESPDDRTPTEEEREALGDDIVPGAPYADPCLGEDEEQERVIEYTLVALPTNTVYNDAGDHDPEGIVYVVEEANVPGMTDGTVTVNDVERIRNGEMNPEPLVIRANVRDCIKITFRNELIERGVAASIHPHFVRYDLQGSDSLNMGYNYDQVVQPGEEEEYRWFANEEGTIFFHDHAEGIMEGMHGPFCSIVIEPEGSEWLDPYSGDPVVSGAQAMIKTPDGKEDFREQTLIYHDFAPLKKRGGDEFVEPARAHNQNAGVMAINYRNAPYYHRDDADPAYLHSSAVHGDPPTPVCEAYEGDTIRLRLVAGPWEEQHNFHAHGLDLETFAFDPNDVTGEIMNVSEAFTFRIREEDGNVEHMDNPDGVPVRDYLLGSSIADDVWNGMWGLVRYWGSETEHLRSLPDREAPEGKLDDDRLKELGHPAPFSDFDWTEYGQKAKLLYDEDDDCDFPPDKDARQNRNVDGKPPEKARDPGYPGPRDAEVRRYDVTAVQTEIPYNCYGDHDPHGIVFVLDEHVEDVVAGRRKPEPITLRANKGDCVEVNLTNALPEHLDDDHADPEMRAERDWEQSNRISLHPTYMTYDVQGSDGATVGFNWDQTVAPGESITYRWFAEELKDGCALWDMADLRGHRHHGAYGQLITEPKDSVWLDPETGEALEPGAGTHALVRDPNGEDFREFGLTFADGQFILNEDDPDNCVVPPNADADDQDPDAPCNQLGDPEDQGYVGVNYRAEPFERRFERGSDAQHLVFSSKEHGDPNTPVLNAVSDDPIVLRVCQAADKPRGLSFHLADHQWRRFEGVEDGIVPAPRIGVQDDIAPGKCTPIRPIGGAGGLADDTGDFVYQAMKLRRRLEAGWWGIFRVRKNPEDFRTPVQPLPDRATGIPVDERIGWVTTRGDLTGDGTEDLVVLVPDSVRGMDDTSALYVFLGPVDERSITDLTGADVEVVGTLHDGEHEHGRAKVRLSDDLGVDDLDTLLGLVTDATVAVGNCDSRRKSENPLSKLDFDPGEKRSGDVDVTLVDGEGDAGEGAKLAIDVTAADVDEDGSLELAIDLEGGPRIVVDGCESLFG